MNTKKIFVDNLNAAKNPILDFDLKVKLFRS